MKHRIIFLTILISLLLLTACQGVVQPPQTEIAVTINADGREIVTKISANSTVQTALVKGGVSLGTLDRVEPPLTTIVALNDHIKVVRIREEYTETQEIIPFQKQIIKNESLAEGETHLLQPGVNGEKLVTYKKVFEDDVEITNLEFKTNIIKEPIAEITMLGVQAPFSSKNVSGVLAYIDNGNAWIINGSTGDRKPVLTSGDLDGHVFSVSYDREWLLFTRKGAAGKGVINTLWVIRLTKEGATPIDLQVNNVIHFADFIPNTSRTISYSTVEPRDAAPGWQANNDIYYKTFSSSGTVSAPIKKLEANSGGIYGWWGTNFVWSADGSRLAYARPDEIGIVSLSEGKLNPLLNITPYETRSDWAWVPGISWSPDGQLFYTSNHNGDASSSKPESSVVFDLTGIPVEGNYQIAVSPNSGMFSNPVASSYLQSGNFLVAYLQAIFPEQSDNSRYRLMVMEQDGSNKDILLPDEGSPGLNPQNIIWAPDFQNGASIAAIYEGNLWLVDAITKERSQVTGDGLITQVSWR